MSNRKENFFDEATKQIKDSYVFQHDESYSDDDVRDIAISLAEYGWKAATKATVEWLSAQKELVGISFEKDFYERYKQFMKDGKL